MKHAGNEIRQAFPEICRQLDLGDDHPIIRNAQQSISTSLINFGNREEANQQLKTLCADAAELLVDAQKLRMFNEFIASPESGQPIPIEVSIYEVLLSI
jgi:hypothetical protein